MKTISFSLSTIPILNLVWSTRARPALVALLLLAAPCTANAQSVRFRLVPLGEIPSTRTSCVPTAITDDGMAVGYCGAGDVDSVAVRWASDGTVEALGKLQGGTFTRAWGINGLGQIVGDGDDDGNDLTSKALLLGGRGWIEIDGSGGSFQSAVGITSGGVIFGNYSTVGSPATETWDPVFWTYDADHDRYDRGDLPKPPLTPTTGFSGALVWAVNGLGAAVGQVASDVVGNRAGLWRNDASHTLVLLDTPTGLGSAAAFGVSNDGRVAGRSYGVPGSEHAVFWQNDSNHTAVDLGTLPGDVSSEAYGVNNNGQVVGASFGQVGRGFVYQDGVLTELTELLDTPFSDWSINEAAGINNAGSIIAVATLAGVRHPVMLVPFEVAKAAQVISFTLPAGPFTFGDLPFTLSATATSGLPVAFAARGACSIAGITVTIVGAGLCEVIASQDGDADWEPAADVTQTAAIAQAAQAITFDALADRRYGDPAFVVSATGGASGNAVTFAAAGNCTVDGSLVTLTAAGSCTITAAQDGNTNYLPADPVSRTFAIAPVAPAESVLVNPGPQTNTEGDKVELVLVATRVRGRFSAPNLPGRLRIDERGVISGRIAKGAAAASPYDVVVTYTGPNGEPATIAFAWTILGTRR